MAAVKVFRNWWKIVKNGIKQFKYNKDAQAAKLDNESIVGIDLAKHGSNVWNVFIALNFSSQKQKRKADLRLSHDAILLTEVFEKSIGMLIKILVAGQSSDTGSSLSSLFTPYT